MIRRQECEQWQFAIGQSAGHGPQCQLAVEGAALHDGEGLNLGAAGDILHGRVNA